MGTAESGRLQSTPKNRHFATYSSHTFWQLNNKSKKKSIFAKSNNWDRTTKVKLTHFSFLAHLITRA
jgi:hypothetical protein